MRALVLAALIELEREFAIWLRKEVVAASAEGWKSLPEAEQRLLHHLLGWPDAATPSEGLYLGEELFAPPAPMSGP